MDVADAVVVEAPSSSSAVVVVVGDSGGGGGGRGSCAAASVSVSAVAVVRGGGGGGGGSVSTAAEEERQLSTPLSPLCVCVSVRKLSAVLSGGVAVSCSAAAAVVATMAPGCLPSTGSSMSVRRAHGRSSSPVRLKFVLYLLTSSERQAKVSFDFARWMPCAELLMRV